MNKTLTTCFSLAVLLAAQGVHACDYPAGVAAPDGATASKEEMIAGQKAVKNYMAKMEEYLACIEAEEAAAVLQAGELDDDTKRRRNEIFNGKYNGAVEEMNRVAEEFNIQVRAFKDRSK